MTSGRNALRRIDSTLADLRGELAELAADAAEDGRALAELKAEELQIYSAFAQVRIDEMSDDGDWRGALGKIDREVQELLVAHDTELEVLAGERTQLERHLASLEDKRGNIQDEHASAMDVHDTAAAETRQRIEEEPTYQQLAEAVEQANAKLRRSILKLETAQQSEKEKGTPYRSDPLFRYLYDRHFGTKEYRAFPLTALLDRWVARLIDYKGNKLNYDRLLELPKFLEAHVDRLDGIANATDEALEAFEREALEEDGVAELKQAVERLSNDLAAVDSNIDQTEISLRSLGEKIDQAAEGGTDSLKKAHAIMASAVAQQSIANLSRLASETNSLEDEGLVDRLRDIDDEKDALEQSQKDTTRALKRERETLSSLESVRQKFKRSRFDSPYSDFKGRHAIASLLSDFLKGAITHDQLWRQIERRHRTRRRDWDNGMGGHQWKDKFGLPEHWGRGNSVDWAEVLMDGASRLPRGRRGGVRIPRSPRPRRSSKPAPRRSSRRGGFRTGGGF